MKNTTLRKLAGLAAIVTLASCMMAPMTAFAASTEVTTITVSDSGNAKNFVAYQLMTSEDGGLDAQGKQIIVYELNSKYTEILKTVTGKEEAEIISYLGGLSSTTGTATGDMRTFADKVYAAIVVAGLDADETTTTGTFDSADQGYYLIAQTAVQGDTDTKSLVMVDTKLATALTVTTKKDLPVFDKYIKDINDTTGVESGWGTDADHDIGDAVEFQLVAQLPSDYDSYAEYKLVFHDDLKENDEGEAVFDTVTVSNVYYDANANGTFDDGDTTVTYTKGEGDSCKTGFTCDFTITIDNLKTLVTTANSDGQVVVEYTAVLNENAVLGEAGNWNGAYLEYSNDPYYTGDSDTLSETPEETVVAFTYQTIVNKTDGNGNALAGAEFTLKKQLADGTWKDIDVVKNTEGTVFTFTGLDDGTYKLSESVTPTGYNGIEDITFEISATHSNKTLTVLSGGTLANGVIETGAITTTVENETGSSLPSTGGIGTTLFYVVGGTMAVGAGVYLIAKKRMNNNEE